MIADRPAVPEWEAFGSEFGDSAGKLVEELELERDCQALLGTDRKPTVPEVLPLVRRYYNIPGNSVGGSLHIVLDDCNIETAHIRWCIKWAEEEKDRAGVALGRVLERMSMTQRRKLYYQH